MKGFEFSVLHFILVLCAAQADKEVCMNGGNRLSGTHQKCSCPPGFKGYDCGDEVTPCEGKPCRNEAKCVDNGDGTFTCKCPENYEGILCETYVRPCDKKPCKNGGKCTDDGVKCFKCECSDGFKGSDCSEKIMPCEISPCKNGGVCSNEKDGGFKCSCTNGYGGIFCERKDAFYTSLILKDYPEYIAKLNEWLPREHEWHLCYRGSKDSFAASSFHSHCDNKGPTVTIVRVGKYIFGGYTDQSWGGSAAYKPSTKSFLFSFKNKDNLKPFKAPEYRYKQNAIYTNPNYGPTFGSGHDFYIVNNGNSATGSYTNFGHTYQPPNGYAYGNQKTKELLAGKYNNFLVNEVEVFYEH